MSLDRIKILTAELNQHNIDYYVNNNPTISDREFDSKLAELAKLELQFKINDPNSPTKRVGSDLTTGFIKVQHKFPMLSIGNSYNINEIFEFQNRVNKSVANQTIIYTTELKYDGASISLVYINGELSHAVTRGNGVQGDNVTSNVRTIKSIPTKLNNVPAYFEVRGEILMYKDDFNKINAEKERAGLEPYANTRNLASGTLKLLSPKEVSKRKLHGYFYQILVESESELEYCMQQVIGFSSNSQYNRIAYLKQLGFVVNLPHISKTLKEVETYISEITKNRHSLPFDIDGLVIKVDNIAIRETIGYTSKNPKWATAYKFETERASAKLLSIDVQVGKTGRVTPVANIEAVNLCNTVVRRATLNNYEWIDAMEIYLDDYVLVEKGGEIIPKVVGVDVSKRTFTKIKILQPTHCPVCGELLYEIEDMIGIFCLNPICDAKIKGRLEHFVGKSGMNIIGFGEAGVEKLVDAGYITTFSDIYDLTLPKLLQVDRLGQTVAFKILKGIEDSKKMPFEKVLYSLSIPKAGETRVKKLCERFGNIDNLIAANVNDIAAMPDFGFIIGNSVVSYLKLIKNEIEKLKNHGLNFSYQKVATGDKLAGKGFVITGILSKPRDYFKDLIIKNGGEFHSGVKKTTTFVVVGSEPGNDKLDKANVYGTKIITETEFFNLL